MKINQIICGDALQIIKKIPNNFVDFILADPPYGTSDGKGKNIRRGQTGDGSFDIDWDKELPLDWIDGLYHIMKDDTWGVIFTDKKEITTVWNKLESNGLSPKNTFYWVKTNKAPTPRPNFKSAVETAVVFTKGSGKPKWYGGGNVDNYLAVPFVSGKEHTGHPTQKPVELFRYLIELFTIPNDLVFDPFIGSGTTAVACKHIGRSYLGIDISEEYCELANMRVNNTVGLNRKADTFFE